MCWLNFRYWSPWFPCSGPAATKVPYGLLCACRVCNHDDDLSVKGERLDLFLNVLVKLFNIGVHGFQPCNKSAVWMYDVVKGATMMMTLRRHAPLGMRFCPN